MIKKVTKKLPGCNHSCVAQLTGRYKFKGPLRTCTLIKSHRCEFVLVARLTSLISQEGLRPDLLEDYFKILSTLKNKKLENIPGISR